MILWLRIVSTIAHKLVVQQLQADLRANVTFD